MYYIIGFSRILSLLQSASDIFHMEKFEILLHYYFFSIFYLLLILYVYSSANFQQLIPTFHDNLEGTTK